MTKVLITVAGAVAIVLFVSFAGTRSVSADNGPHQQDQPSTTDSCAGCHRAHSGQGSYLLVAAEDELCQTCHGDGTGATTNVMAGVSDSGGALRSGGFDTAKINTADPTACNIFDPLWGTVCTPPLADISDVTIGVLADPVASTSRHSIDGSGKKIWGNGAIDSGAAPSGLLGLKCVTCHNQHGNGQYRILRPNPIGDTSPVPTGASDRTTAGIAIPDTFGYTYTTTNYFTATGPSQLTSWCSQCHSRYFAPANLLSPPGGTDSGDDIFAFRHATSGGPGLGCTKCHVAHGTNAASSGIVDTVTWPDGASPTIGANSRLLKMDNRGICQKCHWR